MPFKVTIKTDNAAFDDDKPGEVARMLRGLADLLERQARDGDLTCGQLYDHNGNAVGQYSLT